MQIHSLEWELVGQPETHHHHPSNPKEQNVVSCLKYRVREELLEVGILSVWPPHYGKREQPRAEPSVKNVLVLSDLDLLRLESQQFGTLLQCLAGC